MQKRFYEELLALGGMNKKILLAASGGLDSTVLIHLFLSTKCTIGIAHANFQLRGAESDDDELSIRQSANQLSVPFYSRRFETNNYAIDNGLSTQMAARELRYTWFAELCEKEGYDAVATAHHQDDNLETVLLNYTRGTGLNGLLGIPRKNGAIIRPLLPFSRKQIHSFAIDNGLAWREDSSNASDDYQRNFIRHHVVPRLRELNPSLEETAARNNDRLHAANELARNELARLNERYVSVDGPYTRILKSLFEGFQHPAPILLEFIAVFGFNLDQCYDVISASAGQPGKQFFSASHQLDVDRDALIIRFRKSGSEEVRVEDTSKEVTLGGLRMTISLSQTRDDAALAKLDKDKLHFPLVWRPWRAGDFFYPLGMDHKKKLSDFLIDKKVPRVAKADVTVLESAGEIVWIVGHRIDNRFRITEKTSNPIVFQVS